MITVRLYRYMTGDQGTLGLWTMPGAVYDTLELPWRENRSNVSCIPAGTYPMQYIRTGRPHSGRRDLYWIRGVPGRTGILHHAGTFAGDVRRGFLSDVQGCIITGKSVGTYRGQLAVFSTRAAVREIINQLGGAPAQLTIEDVYS